MSSILPSSPSRKPFASSLEAWGLSPSEVQPDPLEISPERKAEIDECIAWSKKVDVWEIMFCGEPDGDYTAGGDLGYDWPQIEIEYLVDNCHRQAQRHLRKWNKLPEEKKAQLKAECSKICGGEDKWFMCNNDQVTKCSEIILAAMAVKA